MKKKKVKVLQFSIAASKGGRSRYILNNWEKINKEYIQFDFITFSDNLDIEEKLIAEGCKVFHISCYPEDNKQQFIKELDSILDMGYDVIHIHTSYWKDIIVEERAKYKGIKKIIVHSHSTGCGTVLSKNEEEKAMKLHEKIKSKLSSEIATDFWACSDVAAEWLFGNKIEKKNILILKNAIDTKRFMYNKEIRNRMKLEMKLQDRLILGHVGNLTYAKNHSFIIELLSEVVKIKPSTILLLVGDGKLKDKVIQKSKELDVEKNIIMVGHCAYPEKYLQVMDIFLFPSLFEGFPFALLEAQVAGLKCLCSEVITEEVRLTPNVEMLPLGEKDKWINKILLLEKGYDRKDFSREIALKGFDIYEQIKQIEKAYRNL